MKIKYLTIAIVLFAATIIFTSCEKKRGCTKSNALNFDSDACDDDGSCNFSTVTFYANAGFFNGIAIARVDVSVEGNAIGSTQGIYYPGGAPGNCSANGTVSYQFESGDKIDWNAVVYLVNGATLFESGQVSPSRYSECIKVNMTQ